jgi:hypothetical protein
VPTASVLGVTSSVSGLHGGGWITLISAAVGAVTLADPEWLARAAWLQQRRLGVWLALLLTSVIVCTLNLASVERYGLSGIVYPDWGLYLAFISAMVGAGAAQVVRIQAGSR